METKINLLVLDDEEHELVAEKADIYKGKMAESRHPDLTLPNLYLFSMM
jgi:hypothetical protein